jgi:hypothetical protein
VSLASMLVSSVAARQAMTLKLPYSDYIRLKAVAARRKQKGQAIMLEAVRAYLDKL